MNNFFELSLDEKRFVLQVASNHYRLPVQAIEKDVWVTTILQIIFTLPFADKLIFKGGTSLSKVWNQIDRFSEDIDLAVDRSLFGLEGDLTKKQLKKLRKASSVFVREEFCSALSQAMVQYGLSDLCSIEVEADGEGDGTYPEPRKLFIKYKSAYDEVLAYLKPVVMLEIGARSLLEPNQKAKINSFLESSIPNLYTTLIDTEVSTAVPAKTFLEKAFLLHELFTTNGCLAANRKSRHLYDLEKMMDKDFAIEAIRDDELWETIRHHREVFTSVKDVDYTPDIRKRIVLLPPQEVIKVWENDYQTMRSSMLYGQSLSFEQLTARLQELQERFRNLGE